VKARAFWLVAGLFATVLSGVAQAQKFTDRQREDAREMLRLVAADVRKHYYDPKLHGFDFDARVHEVTKSSNPPPASTSPLL